MVFRNGCRQAAGWLLGAMRRRAEGDGEAAAGRRDGRALACLLLAVLTIAGGLALVLSHTAARRSGTDGVLPADAVVAEAGTTACQGREVLPAGTTALQIAALTGRAPIVVVRRGGRVLDRVVATVDSGRRLVRAPIAPPPHDLGDVEVCLALRSRAALATGLTPPLAGGAEVGGTFTRRSMAVDALLPGRQSWWDYAPTVAARVDRGRAWSAGWTVWLIAALVACSLVLAVRVLLRTLVSGRPTPRTAAAIMAVGVLNAAAWSFITPVFQVPDEVAHVAYVQALGETGRPPVAPRSIVVSPEERTAMVDSVFESYHAATWSSLQQQRLLSDLRRPLSRRPSIYVAEGEPEPPLYYALEAIPYRLASGATLLDRIALMRLLSALLAGVTALLSFLFVRECLPARPWAWSVGGLGVAFMPMLGFVSGGVNPDALVFALAAGLFLCVARAWRRGLTMRLALVAGALIGAGMLAKVNFYGLVPGVPFALALAARRTVLAWNGRVVRLVAGTVLLGVVLFALGTGLDLVVWHRPFAVGRPAAPESHVGLLSHLSYIWQVYLPRLPFQANAFPLHPGYQGLFKTFIGTFGLLNAWLPAWAYEAAAAVLASIVLLAVRSLLAEPRELRWRRRELIGYAAMAGVLLLLIGLSADLRRNLMQVVQGRYLLPLLPLFGALLTLGARGAGERWGRVAGIAIVAGTIALSLFGQLVTIAFFYS